MTRLQRGARYSLILAYALASAPRRRLLREALAFAGSLSTRLDQPLPAALHAMTPAAAPQSLNPDAIRDIVDALTAFGAGRPLGICLRRSLTRFHFLRRAGLPVVVVFGARRVEEGIGGHAWLTLDGQPYHEAPQNTLNYVVMYTHPGWAMPSPSQASSGAAVAATEEKSSHPPIPAEQASRPL